MIGDGLVATNAHNLRGDEAPRSPSPTAAARSGTVKAVDVDGDLTVLQVDTAGRTAVAVRREAAGDRPGRLAVPRTATAASGCRSARSAAPSARSGDRGRRIKGSLEHTAPLPAGSSGSPVVDARDGSSGSTPTGSATASTSPCPQTTSCAHASTPSPPAKSEACPPRASAWPQHTWRSLRRSVGLPERDGLLVRVVEDDSPAARAGIQAGDLIVSVAGSPVTDGDGLVEVLANAGDTFEVKVVRGTEERTVSVGGGEATGEA